jgi:hypothetical protein
MGYMLKIINDVADRCTIKVWTVGRVFQIGDDHVVGQGGEANIELGVVWYDIEFLFGGGKRKATTYI